jgi:hypothetical protein
MAEKTGRRTIFFGPSGMGAIVSPAGVAFVRGAQLPKWVKNRPPLASVDFRFSPRADIRRRRKLTRNPSGRGRSGRHRYRNRPKIVVR